MDRLSQLTTALSDRYRIERELGAGGMATVYLAQDLRHDRLVALKVLRTDLAAVIGAERFLQEIRTTANLQHPHILPLHDSGQVDGTVFYVMPYIDGESLRDRLTRDKQLPVEDAMRFAREVADALGYAHERGIIHRDIKPENILLQRGHALVADFGIALAASRTGGSRMTETGLSLGTPHYMSPEQAMGERELGPRSDVYALGCVCYEMLCGEPPFTGPTPQAIVARVMTEPPRSIRSQRPTVPENVEAAVLQALEKLPADRFGSAAEFAGALGQPGFTRVTISSPRAVTALGGRTWKRIAMGLGGLAAILGAALIALVSRPQAPIPAAPPVVRFAVEVPDSIPVDQVKVTPDGTHLLVHSVNRAYLYRFTDMSWVPVPIPELKAFHPASIAPDSRRVAFVDEARNLKVAALGGGPVRTLAAGVRNVVWGHDGFIYLIRRTEGRDRILRVTPEGGALDEVVVAGDSLRRLGFGFLVPGGQLLYTEGTDAPDDRSSGTFAVDVTTRKSRPVGLEPGAWPFAYAATGHLLNYGREAVSVVSFDAARLEARGAPVELLSPVPLGVDFNAGIFAYNASPPGGPALFDRGGRRRELPGIIAPGSWGFGARASPSGHAIVFQRYQSPADRWDVFIYRLPSGPLNRLTSDSAGYNTRPSWAPDGRTVLFLGRERGRISASRIPGDGSGVVEPFLSRPADLNGLASLPDGRVVVEEQGRGLLLLTRGGADTAITLVPAASDPRFPRVSPDGRWLAYSAIALDRREVFVRPLDGGGSRWQISRNGGNNPAWAHSGRELFFYANDTIRVSAVGSGPGFQPGEPRALLRVDYLPDFSGFDVLPGDSLFVAYATSATARERIFVVVNFTEELRAMSPAVPLRPR